MNDKTQFATMIASRLQAAEQANDAASADIGLLIHDLTRHRAHAGFAAQAGHQALENARAALNASVDARARLIDAHNILSRTARRLGVDYITAGPGEGKDQPPVGGGVTGELTAA